MKLFAAVLLILSGVELAAALPATAATIPTLALQVKPKPTEKPPCYTRCTVGYHTFVDPKTGNCGCVPDDPEKQECLEETVCAEFDIPLSPVWDEKSRTCSCEPTSNAELICIAATTCSQGLYPHWNPNTKQCQCLKNTGVSEPTKSQVVTRSTQTPTKVSTTTPAPTVDTCTFLRVFCECGDHHMHWSSEKKSCQCPPCGPVVTLGCENLLVYCEGGDHKMHLNPVSKKCECPLVAASQSAKA
ncbi:hypothetical protein VTL71DRAFT_3698 [Oculimacula yallundae]|uniref:Uncharacterized protein n=1 Tax=Oculimacula yallundae TaxID=86028 RepID=A0ABR4C5E1_9HELO